MRSPASTPICAQHRKIAALEHRLTPEQVIHDGVVFLFSDGNVTDDLIVAVEKPVVGNVSRGETGQLPQGLALPADRGGVVGGWA